MQILIAKMMVRAGLVSCINFQRQDEGWIIELGLNSEIEKGIIERQSGGTRVFKKLDTAYKVVRDIGYLSEISLVQ